MSVMKLENYEEEYLLNKLKQEGDCPKSLLTIVKFAFLTCIQDLMGNLDSKFNSKKGNPAYPRTMLLIVVLYCFSIGISQYSKMEDECKNNRFLLIVTSGLKPTRNTFANFLNKSDEKIIKKVFIRTLVSANDLHLLKLLKLFVDGTDAIVRASIKNKITKKDYETLILIHKWNLLHNGTLVSKKRLKDGLKEKLEEYKNDEEMCKLLKTALKRINIYSVKNYENRDKYKNIMDERGDSPVSLTFPESILMKTKRGVSTFAFNLQEVMTKNHIILTGIPIAEPNDSTALIEVIKDLRETLNFLYEMQKEYGERRNYKEIKSVLERCTIICDSGYYTIFNIMALLINKINGLIMSKLISRENNDKIRSENGLKEKNKDSSKKGFKRVKSGYICPNGCFMELFEVKPVIHRKPHIDDILPYMLREHTFVFKSNSCKKCPYTDSCKNKVINYKSNILLFSMLEKFLDRRINKIYYPRFSCGESINGFLKGDKGILKLVGTTITAVKNEIWLRNTIYNLTRITNLKDTPY